MATVVFPGTFDPITLGHVDIAVRARSMFDHVIVAIANNPNKNTLLSLKARVDLARQSLAHLEGVEVMAAEGLLVEFCESHNAVAIVKGLRSGSDYDYERSMALMNRSITGIETLFVTGDNALSHLASSMVRDVARHGGSIKQYVPHGVEPAVLKALGRTG